MAKIFYSMAGEGRGHAVRVRTIVEALRDEHELHLFAPGDAFDFLQRFYGTNSTSSSIHLHRITGLRFEYTGGKLNLLGSIRRGLQFAASRLPRLVKMLRRRIREERPDLVLSDFEPALPRAAHKEQIPFLSLDHQHVLVGCDLSSLSMELQWYAWWMGWAIRWHYAGRCQGLMTAFYEPPVKAGYEELKLIGPIIRPEVAAMRPEYGEYLLSYLRSTTPARVLEILAEAPQPVRIYGLGERPQCGQATFHPIHEQRFVEDLAGCRAVVCAAGNQLLGEALYLGKPVLAIPEEIHHEQRINAHYLKAMQCGDWTTLEKFDRKFLSNFLSRCNEFRNHCLTRRNCNGTPAAVDAIRRALARHSPPQQWKQAG